MLFYLLSFAIAWTAWAPLLSVKWEMVVLPVPYPILLFICQTLGAFAPLFALLILQRFTNDPTLLRRLLSKLRFRNVPFYWFLIPAITPIAITSITAIVNGIISPDEGILILRPEPLSELGWALILIIPFSFVLGMIGSPLGEEPGWRGYVLGAFAERGQGYRGSMLVAVLWWTWHIPLFFVLDIPLSGYIFWEMAGHSLLIDSVYLLSRKNLLVAMLYHQGINSNFMFFVSATQTVAGVVILLSIALSVRLLAGRFKENLT